LLWRLISFIVVQGFSPPPQCYTAAVFYACPLAYANCTAGPSTPTGLPVCQSSCLAFKSDCAAFAAGLPPAYQAGMGAVDCSTLPATAWPDCLDLFAYYNATNNTHYAVGNRLRPILIAFNVRCST